jgi:hypothetical protein
MKLRRKSSTPDEPEMIGRLFLPNAGSKEELPGAASDREMVQPSTRSSA